MKLFKQSGYMDMQVMPAIIGTVILIIAMGAPGHPEFNMEDNLIVFVVTLVIGMAALLYGFAMHLYALGYPESPFNRHTSPVFMTLICAGAPGFAAYRFYKLEIAPGFIVFTVISCLIVITSVGFAVYRHNNNH